MQGYPRMPLIITIILSVAKSSNCCDNWHRTKNALEFLWILIKEIESRASFFFKRLIICQASHFLWSQSQLDGLNSAFALGPTLMLLCPSPNSPGLSIEHSLLCSVTFHLPSSLLWRELHLLAFTENCCPSSRPLSLQPSKLVLRVTRRGSVLSLGCFYSSLIHITPAQPTAAQKFMSSCCHATFFPSPLTNPPTWRFSSYSPKFHVILQHLTILLGCCNIHGVTRTSSSYC